MHRIVHVVNKLEFFGITNTITLVHCLIYFDILFQAMKRIHDCDVSSDVNQSSVLPINR